MWSVLCGLALVLSLVEPEPAGQESVLIRLWDDPRPIATRDLFWGAGSADRAPRPPFTFVEDSSGGTQPKVIVKDAAGTTWDVKFGPEAHAEVAASRLVWALGYFVDEMYFVREGVITGASDVGRAREFINASGAFSAARFERRDDNVRRLDRAWSFNQNPFARSKELSGLQILMTLVGNWDIEGERNNRIVEVTAPGQETHRRYLVSDLGATFGRMGNRLTSHSKWQLADYRQERFIDAVKDDEVEFDFDGLESNMESVPLEHARWFAALAGELTPSQIRRAFEAAGAMPAEVDGFSAIVIARINQLRDAVGGGVLSAKTPQAR
jgi:hypothetical protein